VSAAALLSPYRLGALELPNRIVMAPMTRNRAGAGNVPTELNATYYAQRASLGLLVAEGTQPAAMGQGYPGTPGLHDDHQEAGWRAVAGAVHDAGGRIFVQLMHAGRISHPSLLPGDALPVAPSVIRPAGQTFAGDPFVTPRALEPEELPGVIAAFANAAQRAVRAGLDGVELHAANGYLLHQFLASATNRRTDAYGGSIARRLRLVVETAAAAAEAIGAEHVGIRISPANPFNDMREDDARAVYAALLDALAPLGLAYVHVVESPPGAGFSALDLARAHWPGTLIANSGAAMPWTPEYAGTIAAAERADLVSFARHALANPDLAERIRRGARLNEPDPSTFYGGGHRGYTDYPTLDARLEDVA
jgi:N-ethylmaleimide reductase